VVLPELTKAANIAMQSSTPIIRPLWMMDPGDRITHTIDDQFFVGDNVSKITFEP
jgi:alpha-glucosidase (family GH31 glycosyl hydrolase)